MFRRAFTMVEMLVAMAVLVVVMGILTVTYSHVTLRTSDAICTATVTWQAKSFSKYLEDSIKNSTGCSQISTNGATVALECDQPATGTTTDAFGVYNTYTPSSVDTSANVHWGLGKRRHFFWSDSTGSVAGTFTPTTLWMAEQTNPGIPLTSNLIQAWTYYGGTGGPYRWKYIDTFTYSVNTTNHTVTYTIGASDWVSSDSANKSPTVLQKAGTSSVTITRTVYWRNQQ